MRERARRAILECKQIAAMTEVPGRITRRFLSPPMRDVHALLGSRMRALDMTVSADAAGNLRGVWNSNSRDAKRIALGSHVDTVPDAGAYDGVLGVTLALEWVDIARELALPLVIEVIAFSEEEGVRYGVPFFGSRAVAGRFDAGLLALTDSAGVTVEAAIRGFGLDPARIVEAELDAHSIAFLEVHIEQGPVLESENLRVAAVGSIAGQSRLSVVFKGQANHAGTTPMSLRHDALAAAAQWIAAVEATAQRCAGMVATVGSIDVEPNASNIVPGTARLTLDLRHPNDTTRISAVEELLAKAAAIANARGLTVAHTSYLDQPAVSMDERLTAMLTAAIVSAGFPERTMTSGAGHDAMVMAAKLPTAMLFLRTPGGISHHPGETVLVEDVEAALHVGREFLIHLCHVVE